MSEENKDIVIADATKDLAMSKPLPTGDERTNMMEWAAALSETKYYDEIVKAGGKNALLAMFLAARDLDINATQALHSGLYIVKGKVSLSSQLMNMMIRRHKHSLVKLVGTDKICTWKGVRRDGTGDTMVSSFSIEDAKRAGLTGNSVWIKYPARMLSNRALSNLAKELFSDCIGNCVIEGEMDYIDVTPQEAPPQKIDRESALFIDKFNLLDLNGVESAFIESIVANTPENRSTLISQCAQNPETFKINLEKFKAKHWNGNKVIEEQ